jgi:hypothetical protein
MPAPNSITSADLALRLEDARAAETQAAEELRFVQIAAVAADVEDSPEESRAAAALARTTEAVSRLQAAYDAAAQAERLQARRLAAADRDAQDAQTVKAAEALEAAGLAMDKAAEQYAKAWLKLVEAGRRCQEEITQRRDVIRRDLQVPSLSPIVENLLHKLSPVSYPASASPAPGARANGLIRDIEKIPGVADQLARRSGWTSQPPAPPLSCRLKAGSAWRGPSLRNRPPC